MVRKRRTELRSEGQSSGSHETAAIRGAGGQQQPPQQRQQPQQPQQQQGGYQAGGERGWTPQCEGYAGHGGGGAPHGGMAPQQYYGGPSEYQECRDPQQYRRGGAPQCHGGPCGPPSGGPSRPSVPELHQATQAPYQSGVTTQTMPYGSSAESQGEAGPSSRAPEPASSIVGQQFHQMTLQPELAPSQAIQPASSRSMGFSLRPGKGSTGTNCIVKANHFLAELPDKDLYQYDVSIIPQVTSRGVNRAVMEQLVKNYRESHLGKRLPAYDGRNSLYTAGPLPFVSKEFKITLIDEDANQAAGEGGNSEW